MAVSSKSEDFFLIYFLPLIENVLLYFVHYKQIMLNIKHKYTIYTEIYTIYNLPHFPTCSPPLS